MLVIEPFDPSRLGRSSQLRLGGLHERKEMIGVAASELIGLGPLYEAIERVLADRLQHREAHVRDRGLHRACQTCVT